MTTHLRPALVWALTWPLIAGAGVALVADPRVGLAVAAGTSITIFAVLSMHDPRVPLVTLALMLWGVLAANKSFAGLGAHNVFVMDVLLALTVLGVLVNPVARTRIRDAQVPVWVLSLFLVLGAVNLARGQGWGVLAAKDSVVNFYAIALIVPAALFPSVDKAAAFLRMCLPALLFGSVAVALGKLAGVTGSGLSLFQMTPATATAAAAAGFLFVALTAGRPSVKSVAAAGVLASAVVLGFARSVWLGSAVAAAMLWLVSIHDRRRIAQVGATAMLTAVAAAVALSFSGSRVLPIIGGKAASFLFQEAGATYDAPVANSRWRLTVWGAAWRERIEPHILVGEGFGFPAVEGTSVSDTLGVSDKRVQLHNGYLTYLMREGLVGLLGFLALVGLAFARVTPALRNLIMYRERTFALAIFGALCVYLVDIGFGVIIEGPMGGIPFWFLVGLAFVVPKTSRPAREIQTAPPRPGNSVAGKEFAERYGRSR